MSMPVSGNRRRPATTRIGLTDDQWVWFADNELVSALLEAEPGDGRPAKRPASHPSIGAALRLRLQGAPEEALLRLQSAAEGDSAQDAHLLAGQIYFEMGRYAEAAASYRALAETAPASIPGHFNLSVCLARIGHFREAVESFRKAVSLDPQRAEAWLGLGVCLTRDNRAAEARIAFEQCLRLRRDYVPALFGRAVALQMQGHYSAALSVYMSLLDARPDMPEALSNALDTARAVDDDEVTREFTARLKRLDHKPRRVLLALARSAIDAGNSGEAARYCEQSAKAGADCYEDCYNLAVCYFRLEQFEDAALAFEHAVRLSPDAIEAKEGLAAAWTEASRPEEAIGAWQEILDLGAGNSNVWFQLGCVHYERRDFEKARAAFEKVMESNPADPESQKALALLAIDRGDAEAARKYCSRLNGAAWYVTFNLALLMQTRGALEESAQLYRKAHTEHPDCAEALVNLGHVLSLLERPVEARQCWIEAIRIRPELVSDCFSLSKAASSPRSKLMNHPGRSAA